MQVGAFKNKENAEKLLKELKAKGFNGFIKMETGKLYKVQVEAFSKKENAENLLKELKTKGFDGFIKIE